MKFVVELITKNADLLAQSEKIQQADCIRAGKSGYQMNEVLFLSCSFKMEKTPSERLPTAKKNKQKFEKNLTAHVKGLKMTPKNAFNFRFVLHFLIT